jgi:2-keto-3-deoxy-L-rhamnonate aldolase RhmA
MAVPRAPATLRQRLDERGVVLCLALTQARTVDIPIMAAACGFDAIYVDLEHTATSLETASMLCSAAIGAGLVPLVRVPSHDHQYMIVGPNPATGYRAMTQVEVVEQLERQTVLAAMLETPEAIDGADEIASVPGLDMLLVGTHDLTAEMGILAQFRHPRFVEAMATVARAARAQGKILGVAGIRDLELLGELVALGVRFISAGTDGGFFMEAAGAHAARLRALRIP